MLTLNMEPTQTWQATRDEGRRRTIKDDDKRLMNMKKNRNMKMKTEEVDKDEDGDEDGDEDEDR